MEQFPGLSAYTASLEYILVTKIMADRPRDDRDIRALAEKIPVTTRRDALTLITSYIAKEDITLDVIQKIGQCFNG